MANINNIKSINNKLEPAEYQNTLLGDIKAWDQENLLNDLWWQNLKDKE